MSSKLRRLLGAPIKRIAVALVGRIEGWKCETLPRFANNPRDLTIELPRRIFGADRMYIGDDVRIGANSMLNAETRYPTTWMRDPSNPRETRQFAPVIRIGHRVTSTGNLTITAFEDVTIEDDVLIAANVYIADGSHGFEHADEPYKYQPIFRIAPIRIGRGSWLGQNVVIMPGVTIGELSIVGANSVVTRDIPPRSIAVGMPARVIKSWDEAARRWVPISEQDANSRTKV
jgi:acetyltransferase-like isoleucine patch superfamily enzyme